MVRQGRLPAKGFLKQEEIPLAPFLETKTVILEGRPAGYVD